MKSYCRFLVFVWNITSVLKTDTVVDFELLKALQAPYFT